MCYVMGDNSELGLPGLHRVGHDCCVQRRGELPLSSILAPFTRFPGKVESAVSSMGALGRRQCIRIEQGLLEIDAAS